MSTVDIIFGTIALVFLLLSVASVLVVYVAIYRQHMRQRSAARLIAEIEASRDRMMAAHYAAPAPIAEPDPWPEHPTWADVQAEAHRFLEAGKKVA